MDAEEKIKHLKSLFYTRKGVEQVKSALTIPVVV